MWGNAFVLHMCNIMRSPTFNVDVMPHCNLNCASCYHFSPIASPAFLELEDFDVPCANLAVAK